LQNFVLEKLPEIGKTRFVYHLLIIVMVALSNAQQRWGVKMAIFQFFPLSE